MSEDFDEDDCGIIIWMQESTYWPPETTVGAQQIFSVKS